MKKVFGSKIFKIVMVSVVVIPLLVIIVDEIQQKLYENRYDARYVKLDSKGDALSDDAISWQCVKDKETGLIWEVKTKDGGLHDWGKKYNWEDANTVYPKKVNAKGWCGFKDWRLPTVEELNGLVYCSNGKVTKIERSWISCHPDILAWQDYDRPTIYTKFFPNTKSSWHWSSSPVDYNSTNAWYISFNYGNLSVVGRSSAEFVRFVRGGQ